MFSLIITIISIALVAALALATIYYGGSSFNRGSADAKASQFINEGQQINGAFAMARADAQAAGVAAPAALADLVTGSYLSQAPAGWTLTAGVPAEAGVDTILGTADDVAAIPGYVSQTVDVTVCESVVTKRNGAEAIADGVFGCVGGAAGTEMFYRF